MIVKVVFGSGKNTQAGWHRGDSVFYLHWWVRIRPCGFRGPATPDDLISCSTRCMTKVENASGSAGGVFSFQESA